MDAQLSHSLTHSLTHSLNSPDEVEKYVGVLTRALERREYATALAVCELLDLPISADSEMKMKWLTRRVCHVFQKQKANLILTWVSQLSACSICLKYAFS